MNEENIKKLWNDIVSKDSRFENAYSLEEFKELLSTPTKRKTQYNKVEIQEYLKSLGIKIEPTYEEFEKKYGPETAPINQNNQKPKPKTTPVILTPQDIWAGKVVEKGMEGDIVKLIQDQLKNKQFLEITTTTRLFGTLTKKAVVNFQNANGIPVTGKVNSETWNKLFAGTNYEEKKPIDKKPEVAPVAPPATTVQSTPTKAPVVDTPKTKEVKGKKVIGLYGGLQEQEEDKGSNTQTKSLQDMKDMLNNAKTLKDDNGRTCFDKVITKLTLGKHPKYRDLMLKIENNQPAYAFRGRDPFEDEEDDFYITSDGNRVYGYFLTSGQEYDLECQTKSIPSEVQTILSDSGWTLQEPPLSSEDYTTKKDIRVVFPRLAKYFPNGKFIFFTGNTLSSKEQVITNELVKNIRALTGEVNKKFCKDAVDVLWDAKQGSERGVEYFTGTTDLQIVRQYVKRCAKELEKNMFDRVLGSKTKDHYKVLVGMRHYDSPQSKFNLGENNNSLEKTIKKKLMEMKKVKSALIS